MPRARRQSGELREHEERDEERRQGDAEMGAEERLVFFPVPSSSASTSNEDIVEDE